jgi:hypothetical protein
MDIVSDSRGERSRVIFRPPPLQAFPLFLKYAFSHGTLVETYFVMIKPRTSVVDSLYPMGRQGQNKGEFTAARHFNMSSFILIYRQVNADAALLITYISLQRGSNNTHNGHDKARS